MNLGSLRHVHEHVRGHYIVQTFIASKSPSSVVQVDPIYFIDSLVKSLKFLCHLVTVNRQHGHSTNLNNDPLPACKTGNVVTINCDLVCFTFFECWGESGDLV